MGYLPYVNDLTTKASVTVDQFMGLNRTDNIRDNEFSDCQNLSAEKFPFITVRKPRESVRTVGNPKALGAGVKLFYVDGTSFYYDGVDKMTVTSTAKSMVDFNGRVIVMPDKKYYDYVDNESGSIGNDYYPDDDDSCPDMDFIAVHYNRVFGVKDSNIYACAQGDVFNWTTFVGEETDAWGADVYSEGKFTGIYAYQNHIVAFKDDFMYELYGKHPSQFTLIEVSRTGCIDNRSILEVNGMLFFLSRTGVYVYTGGQPQNISLNLNETYVKGSAGTDGRRYYLSLYNGTSYKLYVFDTFTKTWLAEDNLNVVDFATLDGVVYALTSDKIYKFRSGTENIPWEFTSKSYTDGSFFKKSLCRLDIRGELGLDSIIEVSVKVDDGEWQSFMKLANDSKVNKDLRLMIPTVWGSRYQYKIGGYGITTIHAIKRTVLVGGEE